MATLVRFHHVAWRDGAGSEFEKKPVPAGSHILHLSDRLVLLLNKEQEVLGQVQGICDKVKAYSHKSFKPELIDVILDLAAREYFWFDVVSPSIGSILLRTVRPASIALDIDVLLDLALLFAKIIDFKSPFTATHSSGVAASAEMLAKYVGFSERECRMMRIAGYLHDLGKLAVPAEILEKPAKLTPDEFNIIKRHTFHTYRILETLDGLDVISQWASFHHERLDGTGYPFHLKKQDLSLGSRIMAVADVFTAITEDRPYRKGMNKDSALKVLEQMAAKSVLDAGLVALLRLHYDEIDYIRTAAQTAVFKEYLEFR